MVCDLPGAVPDGVPGGIFAAVAVIANQVGLSAQRIDEKCQRAHIVIVGVENKAHVIIAKQGIAIAQVGADFFRFGVMGAKPHQQGLTGVHQVGRGVLWSRHVDAWADFHRQVNEHGFLPQGLIHDAIDAVITLHQRHTDGIGLMGWCVRCLAGGGRMSRSHCQQQGQSVVQVVLDQAGRLERSFRRIQGHALWAVYDTMFCGMLVPQREPENRPEVMFFWLGRND